MNRLSPDDRERKNNRGHQKRLLYDRGERPRGANRETRPLEGGKVTRGVALEEEHPS